MQKSISLTLGLCVLLIAALSALTSPDVSTVSDSGSSSLPPAILAGEADYEARQQVIENDLRRYQLSNLDQPAEVRRDRMRAWLEENRSILHEQMAYSSALDVLYVQHNIPPDPKPSEVLAQHAPRTAEEMASPAGRRWTLEYELGLLREANAADPEKLRDAIQGWLQANGEKLAEVERDLRAEAALELVSQDAGSFDQAPSLASLTETPEDASEGVRELFSLQNRMRALYAANPYPESEAGRAPTVHDFEAWRETIQRVTADTAAALDELQRQITKQAEQRLAEEQTDDHPN